MSVDREPASEALPDANGDLGELASPDDVERYYRSYLSDNGRSLYDAAAAIERESGSGYTLSDIARQMGVEYTTAQSIHRTTGRSARKWKEETGTKAPVRLVNAEYEWRETDNGYRWSYDLPEGVADLIHSM